MRFNPARAILDPSDQNYREGRDRNDIQHKFFAPCKVCDISATALCMEYF